VNDRSLEGTFDALARRRPLLPLRCQARRYAWGGFDFIPALMGLPNPAREPFAELWVGAHPLAPSTVVSAQLTAPLDRLLARTADSMLGPEVSARFGATLPYLLKVLDVRGMLSIQAHPDAHQAEDGFRRENTAGIPLGDEHRNYKDGRHKPEAVVALTPLWILYGFKPLDQIAATLDAVPELKPLGPDFGGRLGSAGSDPVARRALLRSLYERAMTSAQDEIDRLLAPLLTRLMTPEARGTLREDSPDFWAARAAEQFAAPGGRIDRGIISIYLLNLVRLEPSQGVFIPAGLLHSYLRGTGVEIMAGSDNVLRGGLTPKHVDISELISIVDFESVPPKILRGERVSEAELRYRTPAAEFELSRLDVAAGRCYRSPAVWGADALLVLDGRAGLRADADSLSLSRGCAVLIPNGRTYEIHTADAATIFRASVPHPL
jgi:mannose-6-phosphate isomerase